MSASEAEMEVGIEGSARTIGSEVRVRVAESSVLRKVQVQEGLSW